MWKIAILALLLAGIGAASSTPGTVPGGAGEEEKIAWQGFTIAISQSTATPPPPDPWRWRIDDAKGEPIANAFGWVRTRDDAITAGKNAIAAMQGQVTPPPGPDAQGAPPPLTSDGNVTGSYNGINWWVKLDDDGTWAWTATNTANDAKRTDDGNASYLVARAELMSWIALQTGPVPTPPKEGVGEPPVPTPTPTNCEILRSDGSFSICIYRPAGSSTYAYRALDGAGMPVATEGGFATKMDAQVGAWRMLAPMPTTIASSTRHGVTLKSDGVLELVDLNAYLARAAPVLQAELAKGEQDPRGLVLAIFQQFWPSVNPFRLRPLGASLDVAANKLAANIPNGAADMARAIWTQSAVVNLGP